MKSADQTRLPFPVRAAGPGEAGARRRLLARWPGEGPEAGLALLAASLDAAEARLGLQGLERVRGIEAPAGTLAVALADRRGPRAILGMPVRLARGLVDSALGREAGDASERLSSGEEGALLFLLDRAAGDWLDAGGARFEIRGVMADPGQGAALLGAEEVWRATARFEVSAVEGPVWLWCAAPGTLPARRGTPAAGPSAAARAWPAEFRVEAGGSRVPLAALGDLAAGDVVVLDRLAHPFGIAGGGGGARLVSGALLREVRWLDAARLEVVSLI